MQIIKVNNLIQSNGRADYKGLDLSKIMSGTQLYPSYDNVAYFFYDGDVAEGGDISIVSETAYNEHKARIEEELAKIDTPEKKIERLEEENRLLQQSLLELTTYASKQDERLATQEQALLELSTVLAGGDE